MVFEKISSQSILAATSNGVSSTTWGYQSTLVCEENNCGIADCCVRKYTHVKVPILHIRIKIFRTDLLVPTKNN